jgi:O-methyltransferase involved in polyketide biosynthesis
MREGRPSRTAQRVAIRRAAHQILETPLIFHDPLALSIIGSDAAAELTKESEMREGRFSRFLRAFLVSRSRYA